MKLANVLNLIIKILETSKISNPKKESKLLLSDVLKINEYEIITNTQKNINEKELKKIISLVEKRAKMCRQVQIHSILHSRIGPIKQ